MSLGIVMNLLAPVGQLGDREQYVRETRGGR